jgi:tetratricopeptide (TPR) repeat protein
MVDQSALNLTKELYVNIAECQIRLGRYAEAEATLEKSAQLHGSDALKARARYLTGVAYRFMGDTAKAEGAFAVVGRYYKSSPVNFAIMAKQIARCAALIDSGHEEEARREVNAQTAAYPKWTAHWGALHMRLLEKQAKAGNVETATAMLNEITALHGTGSQVSLRAKGLVAEAYLNAGQVPPAFDIYNQSVHAPNASDNVWRSWYSLAELYEYNYDYAYAGEIYAKVWKESPRAAVTHWMAAIKCAEQSVTDTMPLDRVPLLHETANSAHPFPLPRIIAAYYLDKITEIEFLSHWDALFPEDSWSLYYVARKLLLQGNREEAVSVVKVLQRQLPEASWRSFQVLKILHSPDKWK